MYHNIFLRPRSCGLASRSLAACTESPPLRQSAAPLRSPRGCGPERRCLAATAALRSSAPPTSSFLAKGMTSQASQRAQLSIPDPSAAVERVAFCAPRAMRWSRGTRTNCRYTHTRTATTRTRAASTPYVRTSTATPHTRAATSRSRAATAPTGTDTTRTRANRF